MNLMKLPDFKSLLCRALTRCFGYSPLRYFTASFILSLGFFVLLFFGFLVFVFSSKLGEKITVAAQTAVGEAKGEWVVVKDLKVGDLLKTDDASVQADEVILQQQLTEDTSITLDSPMFAFEEESSDTAEWEDVANARISLRHRF